MKQIITLVLLFTIGFANAQFDPDRNDFFEVSGIAGTFARDEITLSETETSSSSVSISTPYFGAGLRYGKAVLPFAHLVLGVNYLKGEEMASRGLQITNTDPLTYEISNNSVHQFALQLGLQFRVINTEKIDFSIAGGGMARDGLASIYDLFTGYYTKASFGFNFNERIQLNLKYGYESLQGDILSTALPLELSYHYKIY